MKPARPTLLPLGERGIVFADLSGFSQLVYQCDEDEQRLGDLALACQRLFHHLLLSASEVEIDSFEGDGFLAMIGGGQPATDAWRFAEALHARFREKSHSIFQNMGIRTAIALRVSLHIDRLWTYDLESGKNRVHKMRLGEGLNIGQRVVTSQTCRRFGTAMTRAFYRRLLRLGDDPPRDPDEVIDDRNKYPAPIPVYRIRPEDMILLKEKRKDLFPS